MITDAELLRAFASEASHPAFAELVSRHLNLVYFAAWRRTGDPHLAEDIAQEVFTALARKAPALARREVLASWLYTTTRFVAAKALRARRRRKQREQEAYAMQDSSPDPDWQRLRPVLDESLDQLGERDRTVLLLRFFSNLGFAEIAAKLALTEDAARMRVGRALDKLHGLLVSRGITSTSAAVALALAQEAALAAPANCAPAILQAVTTATAKGAVGASLTTTLLMNKAYLVTAAASLLLFLSGGLNYQQQRRAAALNDQIRAAEIAATHAREDATAAGEALRAIRSELQATRDQVAAVPASQKKIPTAPTREAATAAGPVAEMRVFENKGHGTPAATLETVLWAAAKGDVKTAAEIVYFSPDEAAALKALFEQLSEKTRATFGSPEAAFMAVALSFTNPAGRDQGFFQILDQTEEGPDTLVIRARIGGTTGAKVNTVTLRRFPDGWKQLFTLKGGLTPERKQQFLQTAESIGATTAK